MLTREENDMLTQVGPGTPMGALLRRFWIPALLSSDLRPDDDPRRVRLLGEDFVAFRDTEGNPGFFDEACCHRGASLALGRVEDCGIRCIYHGWKYAVDGTILEAPNVRGQGMRRLKAPAYPVREAGDLVWVYLGPPEEEPPFPAFNFMGVAPENRVVLRNELDCNWVQIMEGGLDSSHVGLLHADVSPYDASYGSTMTSTDNAPVIEVQDTEFGFHYAALREVQAAADGTPQVRARVHTFALPYTTMVSGNQEPSFTFFYVPYDDTHTGYFMCRWHPDQAVDEGPVREWTGFHAPGYFEGDRLAATPENRWLQDRSTMDESFSGYGGLVSIEDYAVDLSMGPVVDRTKEHLVPADLAVIRVRRQLLAAARAVEDGREPAALRADTAAIEVADAVIAAGSPWQALVPRNQVVDGPRDAPVRAGDDR